MQASPSSNYVCWSRNLGQVISDDLVERGFKQVSLEQGKRLLLVEMAIITKLLFFSAFPASALQFNMLILHVIVDCAILIAHSDKTFVDLIKLRLVVFYFERILFQLIFSFLSFSFVVIEQIGQLVIKLKKFLGQFFIVNLTASIEILWFTDGPTVNQKGDLGGSVSHV